MAIKAILNEAELLSRVSEGSERAFEEIFMAYHNQLGEYVLLLTKSRDMAEEIVQDVFVKVWDNRNSLNQIEKFTSYLFILTRNYTLNALRKIANDQKRKEKFSVYQQEEGSPVIDSLSEDIPDYQLLIDEAIAQLPPQQKNVFALKMQGLKNPAIATQMHISPDSVKKYQQYAIKSIIKYVGRREILPILFIVLSRLDK